MLTSKKFQQLVTEIFSSYREAKTEAEKGARTDILDLYDESDARSDAHFRLSELILEVLEDWDNQVVVRRVADFSMRRKSCARNCKIMTGGSSMQCSPCLYR